MHGARVVTETLFREQAVDAQGQRWLGEVRLATPVSHSVWTLTALLFGGAVLAWLFLGTYTRREHVSGSLVPQSGLISVVSVQAGIVTRVLVIKGDRVQAGQRLAIISGEHASAIMGDAMAAVSTQLRAQNAQVQSDLESTRKLARQQIDALHTKISTLALQHHQLAEQMAIAQEQVQSASALLQRIKPLERKGYVSAFRIEEQKNAVLSTRSQYKTLAREQTQITQQLDDARDQLREQPLNTLTALSHLKRERAQLEQSLAQNEAQRSTVLRAPAAGTISSVLVQPGQAIKQGQNALALVPHGTSLQARLLVPSSSIGFILPRQSVDLRYRAFPYQKFGLEHGHVIEISRNALTPQEVADLIGKPSEQPLYLVKVALNNQHIRAYGADIDLKPGMALDADIKLDHRRLIEWIFEPLFGIGKRFGAHV